MQKFLPFLSWLPLVKDTWKSDLFAGITGTIIVIPQAVAFAMIAGMPLEYGLYTAMLTPIIAALFGSSYHLVSGPTTTSSIVLYAVISKFVNVDNDLEAFVSLAILLSFMAGVFKLLMGLARMGKLVNFISNSVIIGFTAGAGVLIACKQIKHIFGIDIPRGSSFYQIFQYLFSHFSEVNGYAVMVAISTLLMAVLIRNIKKITRLYMLIAMIFGSVLTSWLGADAHAIAVVGSIPSHLPPFKIPDFDFNNMKMLFSGALVLASLGLVEASAISRSIALNTRQKLNTNQEFISQGISNIVSSFFSCYTSSASFSRSSINYQSGAKTPFSAIISGLGLLLVVLFFTKYATYLPKPAMGGIILLVGYSLIDFKKIKQIFITSNRELIVFGVTFLGTLFLEFEQALLLGVLLSLFFYLERTSQPNIAVLGLNSERRFTNVLRNKDLKECADLKIIRIDGSLYFASIEEVSDFFTELYEENKVNYLLIEANGINFIDLGAAQWLTSEVLKWQETRGGIYFSGMKFISQDILKKGGFMKIMGLEIFFANKRIAIAEIHKKFTKSCEIKVFDECK